MKTPDKGKLPRRKASARKSTPPRDTCDNRDTRPPRTFRETVLAAGTAFDELAARGASPRECDGLAYAARKAFAALSKRADDGGEYAAAILLETLREAVKGFEALAAGKPEFFRGTARQCFGIPALVSRNPERMAQSVELAGKLEEGEDCVFAIVPKRGRQWRFTPANALAARLVNEITQGLRSYIANPSNYPPEDWRADTVKLAPFSAKTWRSWADIAWRVLDGGKAPELHAKETRICSPSSRDGGEARVWPGDAKKALFDAFRTIATGAGRRDK